MKHITKKLNFEKSKYNADTYVSTNGVREYEISRMAGTTSTYVATSVDGTLYSHANNIEDAETICKKDQEELVRSVLKEEVLEILENIPD